MKEIEIKTKSITPLKAIRKHCLECSGGSPSEVKNCVIPECPLYQYRLGKNPRRKGIGNNSPSPSFMKKKHNLSSTKTN